ncbi:MAG: ABC transporter ATP-binding protein [Anaerolineae bacterium]|nr:ABC transporter ATP-binding protein [Anaerolineae bacterium]
MMPQAVLRTEGLTKRYGSLTAVDGLTLEVYEGEILGFLGPNGAGKTTSINMMCGLLRPDAGRVTIRGVLVTSATAANMPAAGVPEDGSIRARVGVCPQEIVLWERLTCLEQLQFIGQMYGLQGGQARKRGERLLDELGLVDKRKVQARHLSGGMQRRLNLAMALVHDPEIVVLDEPEAGLDPQSRVNVREYIRSLARVKTVILTTHNMDEADRVADRVAIIDQGKLLVLDTPQALKQQVGEGDVVEIGLDGAAAGPEVDGLEASLRALCFPSGRSAVSDVWFDHEQKTLTVHAPNAVSSLPAILDALEGAGQRPSELRLRENTLEDVFIQLTGRRLRE